MGLLEDAVEGIANAIKDLASEEEQTELSFTKEEFNQLLKYRDLIKDIDVDFFFDLLSELYDKIDEQNTIIDTLTKKLAVEGEQDD